MPKVEVTTTLQCSGNRRSGFNKFSKTSGTAWSSGAISTAKWGGVRLRDLIKHAGLQDEIEAEEKGEMRHIRFHSLDGMMASIGIEKAMNPYGDVILCYEMNDKPLPRDHGFPLRIIVPGYAAVRNVKWISKIELSSEEAEGAWQRGLNYKILPPSVTDANGVDLTKTPSINELSVYSGITHLEPAEGSNSNSKPGETIMVKAAGWAYAGGGRNIVRVDLTGDQARSWTPAALLEGSKQHYGRAWAWTFWEAIVPAIVQDDGSVQVYTKAIDASFNSQPESCEHTWNVRGLMNNSWFKKTMTPSK
jgi:sulfite oxidase